MRKKREKTTKKKELKERASFTLDKTTLVVLEEFVNSGRYRNRSHAVECAIKFLKEKENINEDKEGR